MEWLIRVCLLMTISGAGSVSLTIASDSSGVGTFRESLLKPAAVRRVRIAG